MAPLLRTDLTGPEIRRRGCGRGFRYLAADSTPLTDPRALARIKAMVIPPAWEDVWICPRPRGHIQAVGTDAAGRRQYLYHELWRERRDQEKFDRVMEFGRALPRLRAVVERHLHGQGLSRDRVLSAAVRLIDLGFIRPGGEEYAAENGSFGLATIRREHVTCGRGELSFEYTGKSGKHREHFRTWHATVLAAVGLAVSEPAAAESAAARKRAVARVVQDVAGYLGNTPAVARASCIDPRVIALYEQGITIAPALPSLGQGQEFGDVATKGRAERAVLKLVTSRGCAGASGGGRG
jgi:DNA topoisomerase IB